MRTLLSSLLIIVFFAPSYSQSETDRNLLPISICDLTIGQVFEGNNEMYRTFESNMADKLIMHSLKKRDIGNFQIQYIGTIDNKIAYLEMTSNNSIAYDYFANIKSKFSSFITYNSNLTTVFEDESVKITVSKGHKRISIELKLKILD